MRYLPLYANRHLRFLATTGKAVNFATSARYLRVLLLVAVCFHVVLTATVDPTSNESPHALSESIGKARGFLY